MKNKGFGLLKCIAIPLLVGGLSAFISGGGMQTFGMLTQPPLSPPGWLFPVIWTILYILMGIASWLVWTSGANKQDIYYAIMVYGRQLFVNFFLVDFFLSIELVSLCFRMAFAALGVDTCQYPGILPYQKDGSISADSLSCLGDLCRISESGNLVFELRSAFLSHMLYN